MSVATAVAAGGAGPTRRALAAAASTAVAALVAGRPAAARVVTAGRAAVYVACLPPSRGFVALVCSDAVRLPNALVLAQPEADEPFAGVQPGAPALVGSGAVQAGGLQVRAGRWWDPRPRLGHVAPGALSAALAEAGALLPPWPPPGAGMRDLRRAGAALEQACTRLDAAGAAAAAGDLAGLGPGATPAGDDLLAGTLAGAHLFGEAAGAGRAVGFAAALAATLPALEARTTTLSAALLGHAARGEVAAPAAALCRALAGRAPVAAPLRALLAVGHTSGHDLAAGLLLGGRAALAAAPDRKGAT